MIEPSICVRYQIYERFFYDVEIPMIAIVRIVMCLFLLVGIAGAVEVVQPPVTYHLSFETMDFMNDDFASQFEEPTLQETEAERIPRIY